MNARWVSLVLRVAVAGEFLGHGIFSLQGKESFIELLTGAGLSHQAATTLLPIIGTVDITLAVVVLVWPIRAVLLWMAFWGFLTALARPIAGEPVWDFVERWPNWGAPLALLLLAGWPKNLRDWISVGKS